MSGGGGSRGKESKAQYEGRLERWKFNYEQMVNKHDYVIDQYEAQSHNSEQTRQYKNQIAQNEWADKEALRIFDYQNQVAAYNAGVQAYHKQLDYNALAAEISTNDNTRKYNERLTQIDFQNEDLLMQAGFKGRELTSKIQASRAQKSFDYTDVAIKGLVKQGKVLASGQTGRSARKNFQAVMAEQGRAMAVLSDSVTRDELGYNFALERMGKEDNFKQRQLQESMKSAGAQYEADNQQISLQKYSADMQAEAQIPPTPQATPQMSPPIDIPKPTLLKPPDRPTEAQWNKLKPVRGGSGGGGGNMMMGILGIASSFIKFSDDRLKKDINRIGTSPSGIPKYTFKYVADGGHGPTYIGTSAQDLLEMGREDAVTQPEKGGFYKVDYSKLDFDMELVTN